MTRLALLALLALVACAASTHAAEPTAAEVFERRIVPIFKSPNPSSCVECHLAGVDLKDYILPDAGKTFRSLRDQGMIDLDKPEASKIIRLIEMGGDKKPTDVGAKARAAERAAFLAWVTACAADPALRAAPKLPESERAGPAKPDAVVRHGRRDHVLESFEANVWAWRFRCMNCHTEGTPQNAKLVAEKGERVAWVKKAGAAATLDYLLASKLIDAATPENSLLLRKPLGEKHGGGVKFTVGDDAYKGFRRWIEDVAAVKSGKYATAADLPAMTAGPERFGTDLWLKLTDCPPAWGDKLARVEVFAWDAGRGAWEPTPVAVSDRVVWGKGRLWQHNLTLLAAKGSARAAAWRAGTPALPEGKYLARVSVDAGGRLAKDWTAELGPADLAGEVEFAAKWRSGYGAMTSAKAGK
jgi:hypothetical protein